MIRHVYTKLLIEPSRGSILTQVVASPDQFFRRIGPQPTSPIRYVYYEFKYTQPT